MYPVFGSTLYAPWFGFVTLFAFWKAFIQKVGVRAFSIELIPLQQLNPNIVQLSSFSGNFHYWVVSENPSAYLSLIDHSEPGSKSSTFTPLSTLLYT